MKIKLIIPYGAQFIIFNDTLQSWNGMSHWALAAQSMRAVEGVACLHEASGRVTKREKSVVLDAWRILTKTSA